MTAKSDIANINAGSHGRVATGDEVADEPDDTEGGDFTPQVVTWGTMALIAPKGWAKSARNLKTPLLMVDFEPFCVKRLCRASNGVWAWRDVTATDSTAELRVIRGDSKQ